MIPISLKRKIFEKYGNKCVNCHADGDVVSLELSFNLSPIKGGKIEEDNLELLCPNCHAMKDRIHFTEFELSNYLLSLLNKNPNYKNIEVDSKFAKGKNYRADIIAEQKKKNNEYEKLLIEIKKIGSFTRENLISVIKQLKAYRNYSKDSTLVFAFPGKLLEDEYLLFEKENIKVWDRDVISQIFKSEIRSTHHPTFQYLFHFRIPEDESEKLIEDLLKIKPGRDNWFEYQKLVGKALNYLFSKKLSSPITELPDDFKINRRDFILPNYSESGFWAYLRMRYNADFIVVDAKNYTKKVQKKEILQVANYLKKHGTGLLGIIISRNGGDRSSKLTIREIWATEQKLIIVLNDNDFIKMIKAVEPEEILKQRIEEFRLSI